ncbi:MAG: polymorphic toxin-type HINT domain-containing protein [Pirellulales bacterium]
MQDVWKWDRDLATGLVTKSYTPAGRGANDGLNNSASGYYDEIEYYYDPDAEEPSSGELQYVFYADGTTEQWIYDETTRQLKQYVDREGRSTTYKLYESDGADHRKGDVEYVQDALGNKTYFKYTPRVDDVDALPNGLVTQVKDPLGRIVNTEYYTSADGEAHAKHIGLVKKITYAESEGDLNVANKHSTEEFGYDAYGNLVRYVDTAGVVTVSRYDVIGQLLEQRLGGEILEDGKLHQEKGVLLGLYRYDTAGNLRSVTKPDGGGNAAYLTSYEYDSRNRLWKVFDPTAAGKDDAEPTTEFKYTADGLVYEVKTADGLVTTTKYDARRQEIKTTVVGNSDGLVKRGTDSTSFTETSTKFEYDSAGNLQAVVDALGRKTDYAYDADGRLIRTRTADPDGPTTQSSNGETVEALDRLTTTYRYDHNGNVVEIVTINPDQSPEATSSTVSTLSFYDQAGRLIRIQQPRVGNHAKYVAYEYYADGNLKAERSGVTTALPANSDALDSKGAAASGDTVFLETSYAYDHLGRVASVSVDDKTDAMSAMTTSTVYSFEGTGADRHLVQTDTDARQKVTTTTYDSLGRVVRIQSPVPNAVDAQGAALPALVTIYAYNKAGQLETETQTYVGNESGAGNAKTSFTYDEAGRVRTMAAAGGVSTYVYDVMGRLFEDHKADGSYSASHYNSRGQLVLTELKDIGGNKITSTLRTYDEMGLVRYTTDQFGDTTYFEYDGLDRLVRETEKGDVSFADDANPNKTGDKVRKYAYDSAGNLTDVTDPLGKRTAYRNFDSLGRYRYTFEEANGTSSVETRYEYDDLSRITRVKNDASDYTVYEYDGLGRVVREGINIANPASPSAVEYRTYSYDLAGNLERLVDRDNRVTEYAYDDLDRRIAETSKSPAGAFTNKNEYAYDKRGNLAAVRSFGYANNAWVKIADYVYENHDERGRAGKITQTLSVFGTTETVTLTFQYFDRLQTSQRKAPAARSGYVVTATKDGGTLYENTYQFDVAGREVFASQNAPGSDHDKQIARSYYSGNQIAPSDPTDQTPYADRRDIITRRQQNSAGTYAVVSSTATFYEQGDSHLVRRVEHRKANGLVASVDGEKVIHLYNYDSLDRLRRYVDRTHDGDIQNVFDPSTNSVFTAPEPYSRITTTGSENAEDIAYDLEGHVTAFEYDPSAFSYASHYQLTWIAGDRLVKIDNSYANPLPLTESVELAYDALGHLIAKKKADGTVETYFYDGGQETLRFVTGDNSSAPLALAFYSSTGEILLRRCFTVGFLDDHLLDAQRRSTNRSRSDTERRHDLFDRLRRFRRPRKRRRHAASRLALPRRNVRARAHGLLQRRQVDLGHARRPGAFGGRFDRVRSLRLGRSRRPTEARLVRPDDGSSRHGLGRSGGDRPVPGRAQRRRVHPRGRLRVRRRERRHLCRPRHGRGSGDLADLGDSGRGRCGGHGAEGGQRGGQGRQSRRGDRHEGRSSGAGRRHGCGGELGGARGQRLLRQARIDPLGASRRRRGFRRYARPSVGGRGSSRGRLRNAVARTAVLAAGSGAAAALGNATSQLGAMYAGRQEEFDWLQAGVNFAGGALGGALGQAAYDKTCFAAETPMVAQCDAGWKRADEVRADDYLASRDEHDPNAPVVWNRVEEVFIAQGEIWELRWQDRTVRTTAEHPFYVFELGWTPAHELKPGMLLATMDGRYLPLEAIASTGRSETVYNFRVAEGHTYFVGTPQWNAALWAHNRCNLNNNRAKSEFGIYEIMVKGVLHKIGKADMGRITKSSELPTRLHQQLRKLRKDHGFENVTYTVSSLGTMTTKRAKRFETARLQAYYDSTQIIPIGNIKSFNPKQ